MWIKQSYEEEFEHFILDMKDKYPKALFELNGIDDAMLDMTKFSRNYFLKNNVADVSIDANANVQIKNVSTYKSEVHKGLDKLNSYYLLWKTAKKQWSTKEANRLLEKELNKELNTQDSGNSYLPYCFAFDVYDVYLQGLPFIDNYPSTPTKHSDVFLQHVIQLLQYAAPQMMGATAIPNFLVIYSGLLKHDSENNSYPIPDHRTEKKLFKRYLEQRFQELVFLLNQPLRQSQSIFTNITIFDSIFLEEMCKKYLIHDQNIDIDFAMYIQKEFLKAYNGFMAKRITTFPILTAQFKKDEEGNIEDKDFLNFISEINLEFGHINIYSDNSLTALSACCRLLVNVEDLLKVSHDENMNLIGGSSVKVGSFGVVTVNLVRVALMAKEDKEVFFELLKEQTKDAYRLNYCRRLLIENKINQGQMPLYTYGLMDIKNQYSTLGINGLYECVKYMGYDLAEENEEGQTFAIDILKTLSYMMDESIKKYNFRCNIEQIPAEQTSSKMALADKMLYKQEEYKIYGNQFVPLINTTSIYNRINLQAKFEEYFSGGCILHLNMGEKIPTKTIMKNLIKDTVKKGVKYFAVNYFFQKCEDGHIAVEAPSCLICGKKPIEKYTRIVGFFVPISSWSKERRVEFDDRKKYSNKDFEGENDG